jgi:hypothetical protein
MIRKRNFTVAIELNEQTILKKEFFFLKDADDWACKVIRQILVCGAVATIVDKRTGEIMGIIQR